MQFYFYRMELRRLPYRSAVYQDRIGITFIGKYHKPDRQKCIGFFFKRTGRITFQCLTFLCHEIIIQKFVKTIPGTSSRYIAQGVITVILQVCVEAGKIACLKIDQIGSVKRFQLFRDLIWYFFGSVYRYFLKRSNRFPGRNHK